MQYIKHFSKYKVNSLISIDTSLAVSQETEQLQEQVQYIQVKINCGKDVFFWRQLLHHHLQKILKY